LGIIERCMGEPIFLEVVLLAVDFEFDGRDEIEDPLEEGLTAAGIGEVTGGGGGSGVVIIDVEVQELEAGLAFLRKELKALGVARSTTIKQYQPEKVVHMVYE
jgi:hypothetical protein